jgi:hypothetical protein
MGLKSSKIEEPGDEIIDISNKFCWCMNGSKFICLNDGKKIEMNLDNTMIYVVNYNDSFEKFLTEKQKENADIIVSYYDKLFYKEFNTNNKVLEFISISNKSIIEHFRLVEFENSNEYFNGSFVYKTSLSDSLKFNSRVYYIRINSSDKYFVKFQINNKSLFEFKIEDLRFINSSCQINTTTDEITFENKELGINLGTYKYNTSKQKFNKYGYYVFNMKNDYDNYMEMSKWNELKNIKFEFCNCIDGLKTDLIGTIEISDIKKISVHKMKSMPILIEV